MDTWKVGWAREDGHIKQAHAPGHDRPRCVYVDFLRTGPAVSKTLRHQLQNAAAIRRIGDLLIVDIAVEDGVACGATAIHMPTGDAVTIAAKAVVIATGGLTRLYRRNSASLNMGGDGYALGVARRRATDRHGIRAVFPDRPSGAAAGRHWIRSCGIRSATSSAAFCSTARCRNSNRITRRRVGRNDGKYVLTRDLATYAIMKEVEAGRGSPAGGAYLSFKHVPEAELRRAFGPVIDTLAKNGIDLTQRPIEVAPIAHYHMGGVKVDTRFETAVPNLFAAAKRSAAPTAPTGCPAMRSPRLWCSARAPAAAPRPQRATANQATRDARAPSHPPSICSARRSRSTAINPAALINELQAVMMEKVGPFRTQDKLDEAIGDIGRHGAGDRRRSDGGRRAVRCRADRLARSAQHDAGRAQRRRGRPGAARKPRRHQREDFPGLDPHCEFNQIVTLRDGEIALSRSCGRSDLRSGRQLASQACRHDRDASHSPRRAERAGQGRALRGAVRRRPDRARRFALYPRACRSDARLPLSPASMPMPARNA